MLSWGLSVRCEGLWGSNVRDGGCWTSAKNSSSVQAQASAHCSCLQIITSTCFPLPPSLIMKTMTRRWVGVGMLLTCVQNHCIVSRQTAHTPLLEVIFESLRNNRPTKISCFVLHHSICRFGFLDFTSSTFLLSWTLWSLAQHHRKSSPVFWTISPSASVDVLPVPCQTISSPSEPNDMECSAISSTLKQLVDLFTLSIVLKR